MPNTYVQGAIVRLTGKFRDEDGVLADPAIVTLKVENPQGNEATYTDAVKESTGIYYRDVIVATDGSWHYRWEGVYGQVDEEEFYVRKSVFY